ncbi:unnamed protein product [Caenorhabditis brenneri]
MSSDLTLLSLPEVAMKHILEQLDYSSIQCLRKTCQQLHQFIDQTSLDLQVEEVYLEFSPTKFVFAVTFSPGQTTTLEYSGSCKIKKNNKEILIEGTNFQDVFWRDFELFVRQCSIKTLDFNVKGEIAEWKLPQKIRTEEILSTWGFQEKIMDIIPVLDEKSIKSIYIFIKERGMVFGLEEAVKLPQWKNAEKMSIFNGFVDGKIDNFAYFLDVTVTLEEFVLEDVMKVKNSFSSSKMTCFRLYFHNYEGHFNRIKEVLTDKFGKPDASADTTLWIFEIPNSTNFLQMRLLDDGLIFKRLEAKCAF